MYLSELSESLLLSHILVAMVLNTLLLGFVALLPKKLLTPAGILHAWILGVLVWLSFQWPGYVVVGFYFIVGSSVTRIGMEKKEAAGIAEKRSGARGPENVWGSALTGALCCLGVLGLRWLIPDSTVTVLAIDLLMLGYVASFSTKLSDTCASEVGKAYGKRTFLITTLKSVPPGTEGAISLEGTVAGLVAALAMAMVGWAVGLMDSIGLLWCAIAAFIATNLESVIGATWQGKIHWLTNEVVNFINTLIGAMVAMMLAVIYSQLWMLF